MTAPENRYLGLPISVLFGLLISPINWVALPALAQITPDNSLGAERSRLQGNVINGGAQRGANLFHSFSDFNVGNGQRIDFANPAGVDRILTRVTGGNRSRILGILGVLGNADLFLMNPNGILFGPNARLDIRGSFVATTATSLFFDNGFAYSTVDPQVPPLLTMNVPLGLNYGAAPAGIQLQGTSLRVRNGKTVALMGGAVELDAAELLAFGGQIHLGGINEPGVITFGHLLQPKLANGVDRADVAMTNGSFIDVRAGGGGSISIQANNVSLLDGSTLKAGIAFRQGSSNSRAGNIDIDATENVIVEGAGDISNDIAPRGTGVGGNLSIAARSLFVLNGAQLSASTGGQGNAGNLTLQTLDKVVFDGVAASDGLASSAFSVVDRGAVGNAGTVSITTGSLQVTNGAQINTRTSGRGNAGLVKIIAHDRVVIDPRNSLGSTSGIFSRVNIGAIGQGGTIDLTTGTLRLTNGAQLSSTTSSRGNAGDIIINARDTVTVDGEDDFGFPSGIFSRVNPDAIGQGGNILITTGSFSVTNGASLSASTRSQGNAGQIKITARDQVVVNGSNRQGIPTLILSAVEPNAIGNGGNIQIMADSLSVSDRARITAETRGQGNAGNISGTLNTLEISQAGELRTTTASTGAAGNMLFNVRDRVSLSGSNSGLFANTASNSSGKGGGIVVNTDRLEMQDSARIAVGSQGQGQGGDIGIQANQLTLNDRAALSAETASTQGGNIQIQNSGLLLLRRNSLISTSAGTAQAGGNGGNITIDSGFIVSVLPENNDIRANAFTGNGGNIDVTAQGIYGIQFQPVDTPNSDITASSQFGLNGTIILNTPDVDPARGTVALPTTFSTPPLAQGCVASNSQTSRFVSTGRGGVPTNPIAPLTADTIWQDWEIPLESERRDLEETKSRRAVAHSDTPSLPYPPNIIEAQGLKVLPDGTVFLTAQAATVLPSPTRSEHQSCLQVVRFRQG